MAALSIFYKMFIMRVGLPVAVNSLHCCYLVLKAFIVTRKITR